MDDSAKSELSPVQSDSSTDAANQPSPDLSTNTPNYVPTSPEFLTEIGQDNKPAQPIADLSSANLNLTDSNSAASSLSSNSPVTDIPDLTLPTNEVDFNLPPIGQPETSIQADQTVSTGGNSFRPPQDVIDSLTDDQKKFINGASWGPLLSLPFLIANNSLKHSLIMYVVSAIPLVNIAMVIVYIIHGRRIAWQSHYWDSFDSYKRNMSKWSKWAKIYFLVVIGMSIVGIIAAVSLIFINPQPALQEAGDSVRKSDVMQAVSAIESCFTQKATSNYKDCDSIAKLAAGNYLASANSIKDVTIQSNQEVDEVVVFTTLESKDVACEEGSGLPAYFSYDSDTGRAKIICGTKPSVSQSSPTPTAQQPTPTKAKATPTVNFSR